MHRYLTLLAGALSLVSAPVLAQTTWLSTDGDAVLKSFKFKTGETLPEVKMHYTTLGKPHRNAKGEIDNAVMVLHGTGGTGKQFLQPQFADELYGPGQPFDITKLYVILPDSIGHGGSSKPSDGMRMAFPKYDYDDMVDAQYRLLTERLGVKRLKVILGTSMGCMHAFVWAEKYPGFAERLAPFACMPVEIAGENRMWRQASIDAIKADPLWNNGNYTSPPLSGMRTVAILGLIAGANPLGFQARYPTRAEAEAYQADVIAKALASGRDANDAIYQLDSSRNYNPAPGLEKIAVPVLWINSEDDFINPWNLGITQREVKRLPKAKFVLLPATPETRGHGTHTWAKFWKPYLEQLMELPAN